MLVAQKTGGDVRAAAPHNSHFTSFRQHVSGYSGALEPFYSAYDPGENSLAKRSYSLVAAACHLHEFDFLRPKPEFFQHSAGGVIARSTEAVGTNPFAFERRNTLDCRLYDKLVGCRFTAGDDDYICSRCRRLSSSLGRACINRNLSGEQRRHPV